MGHRAEKRSLCPPATQNPSCNLHLKESEGRDAQENYNISGYHSPLGNANTLMMRKKKITERMPLQMLSSGTESSLKIENIENSFSDLNRKPKRRPLSII